MNRILFFWVGLLLVVMTGMWILIGLPSSAPAKILLPALGQTYYVRTDGGSATRCTGRVDAPDPGSGTNRPCAWDHPFRALPPGGTPRITGGDTLIIASGSYKMGYGALGAEACDYEASYDCLMPPIPSGPDASHPTRILGSGWNAGCANPPELWGTGRPWFIVNLTDSSNVQIACMEITDHSSCIEDHLFPIGGSPYTCQRDTPPYGDWAATGLYAEDSTNVHLEDLNIHGLANTGIQAGRLTDWTVENVRLAGNGLAGWNSDLVGDGSNSENHGTFIFRHWTVEWNGCGETYPDEQYIGCWGQEAGGYGDGAGFGGTTGGHYIIEDSAFLHNTSDGLDMLYVRLPGALIEIRRTISEGNDGNQIKTSGNVTIENSIIVSNCGFFHGMPYWNNDDDCRAVGDSLVFDLNPGGQATVTNSTITGEGNCLLIAGCALDKTCNGSEQVLMRNVIFQGQKVFWSPGDDTCFAWYDNESSPPMPADPFVVEYSLITGVRFGNVDPCPGLHNLCDVTSGLENTAIDAFDAHLLAGSLAINAGTTNGAPADDFDGNARDTHPDIGAYEYNASPPPSGADVYLPLVLRAGGAVSTPTPTPTNTSIRTATISIAPSTNTPTKTSTSTPTHTSTPGVTSTPGADNPNPPTNPVKLIFIHHSSGENWLADDNGGLGIALMNNNYFVSDTNYGWTVDGDIIGDRTDIGNWWEWFRGPNSATYLNALYTEYGQNSGYSRLATDPGGENKIVMFKSCFPNSALQGDPAAAPPPITSNPLRGQDAYSEYHTVANAKGIYIDLLEYFRAHRDKLFVVITAPPLQDGTWANNARAFNNWLVNDWLNGYPYKNVAVFDFYNVLTSNGGDPDTSDIGWVNGNHHRWWNSAVQHQQTVASDTAAYPSGSDDDHTNYIGNEKATSEFVQLLNVFYHRWAAESP